MKACQLLLATWGAAVFAMPVAADDKTKSQESYLTFDTPNGILISLAEEESKATLGGNFIMPDSLIGASFTGKVTDKKAEFATLDGINSDVKLAVNYSHFFPNLDTPSSKSKITYSKDTAQKAKVLVFECKFLNEKIKELKPEEQLVDQCDNEIHIDRKLENSLEYSQNDAVELMDKAEKIQAKCKIYNSKGWADRLEVDKMCERVEVLANTLTHSSKPPQDFINEFSVLNVSLGYTQTKFEWLDVENITSDDKTEDETEEGIELAISYASFNWERKFKWEVGVKFQKGYSFASANRERELCFEYDADNSITECLKGRLLPPLEAETITPFVSFTKRYFDGPIDSIGLDIAHTIEDKTDQDGNDVGLDRWGVEIPIHVITFLDKKISAGFKLSWVSETLGKEDPLKFTVFVSAPLTFD